jgi:hypothetical protein
MTTDWKALCELLIDEWDAASGDPDMISFAIAIDRARTALAQPEPVGPTDEELHQLWLDLYAFHDGPTSGDVAEIARAVLARYARPTITPIPVSEAQPEPGPTDLRDETLLVEADAYFLYGEGKYTASLEEVVAFARRMLLAGQRYTHPTPPPIPVSERLPGPEDCDAEGCCWWWRMDGVEAHWELISLGDPIGHNESCAPHVSYGPWLPFHALPLPTAVDGPGG